MGTSHTAPVRITKQAIAVFGTALSHPGKSLRFPVRKIQFFLNKHRVDYIEKPMNIAIGPNCSEGILSREIFWILARYRYDTIPLSCCPDGAIDCFADHRIVGNSMQLIKIQELWHFRTYAQKSLQVV